MLATRIVVRWLGNFNRTQETATAYLERVQLFFLANDIAAGKQVSVLLTLVGPKVYELLRSLVSPNLLHAGQDLRGTRGAL